ncbi:MAG TPA: PEP/pyruvate-binding domain-containing protein, partial [Flavisolibacter sp.]|nr:PEP/pyruvate-binding domain-containing protein [Flavisolibacter sp.]
MNSSCILLLDQVGLQDIHLVGGKNASLGEMLQNLTKLGIKIPDGFVITTTAYSEFIQHNHLDEEIRNIVKKIDYASVESLRRAGLTVRNLIKNARFPAQLSQQIIHAYYVLSNQYGQEITD